MIRVDNCLVGGNWLQDVVVDWDREGCISVLRVAGEQDNPLPLTSGRLIPGFIDVQINGGGGVLFNQTPTLAGINKMFAAHHQFGTTAMLPTLITDEIEVMQRAATAISQAMAESAPGILGVHFEGPNLSKAKKGVHKTDFIHPPCDEELALYTRKDLGKVLLTVAPETVPADIITDLTTQGVLVFLGHSNADADTVERALAAGATGFTHLYNAMSPMQSREPGMVGVALADNDSFCGLILDHYHVHPTAARLAVKAKGADKVMLVTDAMAHVGTDCRELPFFDTVINRTDDKLTTPDGTLAGSCLNMRDAVKNAHFDLGIELSEAIAMASTTPARCLNLSDRGEIALGKRADMLLLDDKFNLVRRFLAGKEVLD